LRRHENCALGGMHTPLRYEVLEHVLSVVALSRPLVAAIQRKDRDLASQVRRALSSVGLNVAEGFGTASGNARLRFETARGSLYEAQAGIRIAIAWGYFTEEYAASALCAIDELGGRVYGLSQR
jgi:four helix bundle protein